MKDLIAGLALVAGAVALGRGRRGLSGLGLMSDSTMLVIEMYEEGRITATEMYMKILSDSPGDLYEAMFHVDQMERADASDRYERSRSRR